MRKIYISALVVSLFTSCEKLPSTNGNLEGGNPDYQVAYLENAAINDVKVKDATGSEKDTEIKVRIANPMNTDTYYYVNVDEELIKTYNQKNQVDYESLPALNYEMTYTNNGETQKGSSIKVLVPKGKVNSAGTLTFKVKPMVDSDGKELPGSNNYALAVNLKAEEPAITIQRNRESSIFFMRRSFKAKVANVNGGAFEMIYGEDTGAQVRGKVYAGDKKIDEWTMQYSFAIKDLESNWGLMYENPRTNTDSRLWNTVESNGKFLLRYGASSTLFFNTAEGKDFVYKAAGSTPTDATKWYHMAMTYKKEDGRPILKIYINGKLMCDTPSPVIVDDFPLICFGNGRTKGWVREIRFWSKALTEGQVASTQYFVKPDSEGLELYVPFNEQPWEEVGGKRVIKNASTYANKKLPDTWYLHSKGSGYAFPSNVNYNTEVEF